MPLDNCLLQALEVVEGDRARWYGHPSESAEGIAAMWTAYLKPKLKDGEEVTPYEVPFLMMLMKIARERNNPGENRDNLVDIAGYARNAEMMNERKED